MVWCLERDFCMKHFFEEGHSRQVTWSELTDRVIRENSFSTPIKKMDLFSYEKGLIGEVNQEIRKMKLNI